MTIIPTLSPSTPVSRLTALALDAPKNFSIPTGDGMHPARGRLMADLVLDAAADLFADAAANAAAAAASACSSLTLAKKDLIDGALAVSGAEDCDVPWQEL